MKESRDKKVTWLTESLKKAMLVSGIEKIESPLFKISLRRSEAVDVEIPEALPVDWQVKQVTITADKVKLQVEQMQGQRDSSGRSQSQVEGDGFGNFDQNRELER